MSIESLLLSTWEEDGFVGKTRVPVGMSDIDVLAILADEGGVRVGETKVPEGSQTIYPVDDSSLVWIASQPQQDFADWLADFGWSNWLRNLSKLWDSEGRPVVPWLLHASKVEVIEVVFCCNVAVLCDRQQVDELLGRAVLRSLQENTAIGGRLDLKNRVQASVKPTLEIITDLISAVFRRIERGYGRRFGNPFKDMCREIHRYLRPEFDRLPYDKQGQKLGGRKSPFEDMMRRETALGLLRAMGIGDGEIQEWLGSGG
jgi:hypothetical protein